MSPGVQRTWTAWICLLLGGSAGAQQSVPTATVAGLTVLRAPLAAPDLAALDGLGTAPACPRPAARLDQVLYDDLMGAGAALSCGNAFGQLLPFPGPVRDPAESFKVMARQITEARREVLVANMVWDSGPNAPGRLVAEAIADLHRQVRGHPEAFPQGVTVRILLGNSIRFDSLLDPSTNAFNAAQDLLAAGLDLAGTPEPGWSLQVANYRYAFPHSHMKLLVVDGETVTTGGFNISTLHLPETVPGGLNVFDLGLQVRGPVARQATAAFRDAWQSSQPLRCASEAPADQVRNRCALGAESTPYPLIWWPAKAAGQARVYGLYRRSGYPAADQALVDLFAAATSQIDLLQSQVSGDLACDLSLGAAGSCPLETQGLPVWQAMVRVVREQRVHVRMVLDQDPALRLEALALLASVQRALRPVGLDHLVEARWSAHRLHTKAAVVDQEMAVVGSINLHFSSFGASGLTEYALATSDPAALQAVEQTFDDEWAQARPVTLPWWTRSWPSGS